MIKNELIKIFKKKTFYVVMILTLIATLLLSYFSQRRENNQYMNSGYNNISLQEELAYCKSEEAQKLSKEELGFNEYCKGVEKDLSIYNELNTELAKHIFIQEFQRSNTDFNKTFLKYKDITDFKVFVKDKLLILEKALSTTKNKEEKLELELEKEKLNLRIDKNISYDNSYMDRTLANYIHSKRELLSLEAKKNKTKNDLDYLKSLKSSVALDKYNIDNNKYHINVETSKFIPNFMIQLVQNMQIFVFVLIIIVAAISVSEEFQNGTIKDLLIRPFKREKIYLSKLISLIIFMIISLITFTLIAYIISILFGDIRTINLKYAVYDFNKESVVALNPFIWSLKLMFAHGFGYLVYLSLTMFLALITESNGLAIGISFFAFTFEGILVTVIGMRRSIVNLLPSVHMPITDYAFGHKPMFLEQVGNLQTSITVLVLYIVITTIISIIIFKKKDIKNV